MIEWSERLLWYGVGPLFVVLLLEHVLLTRLYRKRSSLQRLTKHLTKSGVTDLAMWATLWVPVSSFYFYIRFVTVPGLALAVLFWLNRTFEWHGLFGGNLFGSYALNFVVWYLVYDFAYYLAHYLLHRIPVLWEFHKLHHSATEMNVVTGTRVSFAERAFNQLVSFGLLSLVCGFPTPQTAFALLIVRQVVELLQHSDLPWDYGKLGLLLAGPRFHRMHHSDCEDDYDANFGNLFTFWDRIFGTVSPRYAKEGSASADTVEMGLGDDAENRHYSRWHFAVINHTFLHYALSAGRYLLNRTR